MTSYQFTSESVGIGHPDKVCDQISDAILDACLMQDENSRAGIETLVTQQRVIVAGEINTNANINFEQIVRDTIKEIGYTNPELEFDFQNAKVEILIHQQSPDISQGVDEDKGSFQDQGAGDQGIMFGYATNETKNYMPLAINLANEILNKAKDFRINKIMPYLNPDCKSQVTLNYDENNNPIRIDTIVFSTHHSKDVSLEEIKNDAIEKIIKPICIHLMDNDTKILVNPTGRFVHGGPFADAGLTGRKIITDTYGGYGRHGGGAFSGKDPSKVDRSATYAARWIAKNIVAAGLADTCEIQLSYAIGYPKPTSINVNTYNTEKVKKEIIEKAINIVFDLSPKGIVQALNLKKPIYKKTAYGGHFGQEPEGDYFTWEKLDKVEELRDVVKSLLFSS